MAFTVQRKHVFIIFVVLAGILFLHYFNVLRPVEQGITRIVTPGIRSLSRFGAVFGDLRGYITEKQTLTKRVQTLETALATQQQETAERTLLEEENRALREQLTFAQRTATTPIVSYVVGKSIDNTANTVIIDRGEADGVVNQAPVIAGDGLLVGKIAKVNPHTAIVRLINDPRSKVAVTVLNKDKSIGLVEGGFGVSVTLTTVLQADTLEAGDLVVTSGLEELVPRGLLIGTIANVEKENYRPFQEATITPAAPLGRLTLVGVLPPPSSL
ncbi:MAG: rod shape-determining protein MreC [Patescibacteria group bacterium]